jgi:hypothetical protein
MNVSSPPVCRPTLKVLHGSTARRMHTSPSVIPSRAAIARAISSLVWPLRRVTGFGGHSFGVIQQRLGAALHVGGEPGQRRALAPQQRWQRARHVQPAHMTLEDQPVEHRETSQHPIPMNLLECVHLAPPRPRRGVSTSDARAQGRLRRPGQTSSTTGSPFGCGRAERSERGRASGHLVHSSGGAVDRRVEDVGTGRWCACASRIACSALAQCAVVVRAVWRLLGADRRGGVVQRMATCGCRW